MDLIETLRSTGAVRAFEPEPVPDDVIARILDTARYAPNGGNQQSWHVVVLKDSLRIISELSSGEQQAVTLLGLYDLSYEEAASMSGLPVGTMKSRLSRGRGLLRKRLADVASSYGIGKGVQGDN